MECELMPGMPLFIFSPICFLCPHPQLQCKTRVLLLYLPDPKFGTDTPGPVFHWRGNWGFCLPSDNTSHVVMQCCCTPAQSLLWPLWRGRGALRFAHDWLWCAEPDSVLLWVYFALDELLFFCLAETQRISPQQHPHLRKVSVSESNVLLDEEVLTDPKIQALLLTVLVSFLLCVVCYFLMSF